MDFERYAQRLLNPFRGAVHTLCYGCAEAVTVDAVHWHIYVANEALFQDGGGTRQMQIGEMRYGSWSAAHGLRRGRLSPSEDFRRMQAMGAYLYEHLTQMHEQVPFPFKDHLELWLLAPEAQPLALLNSAIDTHEIDLEQSIQWRAGFAAREGFVSNAMENLAEVVVTTPSASDYLAHYINTRAGTPPAAQWFRRATDGSGSGLFGIGLPGTHRAYPRTRLVSPVISGVQGSRWCSPSIDRRLPSLAGAVAAAVATTRSRHAPGI